MQCNDLRSDAAGMPSACTGMWSLQCLSCLLYREWKWSINSSFDIIILPDDSNWCVARPQSLAQTAACLCLLMLGCEPATC